jgi:glycosyltransferase involved in cell wall biosynthesis
MTAIEERHDPRPRMLFLRDYQRFSGGHLKYLHYLGHTLAHGRFRPLLHVTGQSLPELDRMIPDGVARVSLPKRCEAIFVAGTDWDILDAAGQDTADTPVINLLQHVRHADPDHPLFRFLTRPALRLCVSTEVARAVSATGLANGPIEVIENGIDLSRLARLRDGDGDGDGAGRVKSGIVVAGSKAPQLARDIARGLEERDLAVQTLTEHMPRAAFLRRIADAEIAVLLPNPTEGFFLPALEAMALGTAVVMPDCIGARGFARDGETCLYAVRDAGALADAAAALAADPARRTPLCAEARRMAARHSLAAERRAAFALLDRFADRFAP